MARQICLRFVVGDKYNDARAILELQDLIKTEWLERNGTNAHAADAVILRELETVGGLPYFCLVGRGSTTGTLRCAQQTGQFCGIHAQARTLVKSPVKQARKSRDAMPEHRENQARWWLCTGSYCPGWCVVNRACARAAHVGDTFILIPQELVPARMDCMARSATV